LLHSIQHSGEKFSIFGDDYPTPDGTCVRDYVHVSDIAQAHIRAMHALNEGRSGVFNIGSGTGYTVKQVLQTVEQITGKKVPVVIGPRRAGDPAVLVASNDKLSSELGWRPRRSSLGDIVGSAWSWKQRFPNGYLSMSQALTI
jgi:UDP-glucose 4-epimerase